MIVTVNMGVAVTIATADAQVYFCGQLTHSGDLLPFVFVSRRASSIMNNIYCNLAFS